MLALYLEGWALVQAGKEKEGKKRMEAAHWAPLGDGEVRFASCRGWKVTASARRRGERELLLRLSPAGSLYAAQALRETAIDALDGKDFAAAAADRSGRCCVV